MIDWLLGPTPGSLQNREAVEIFNHQVQPRLLSTEDRLAQLENQVAALTTLVREMRQSSKS